MAKRKGPAKRKGGKGAAGAPRRAPGDADDDREMLDYQAFGFTKLEREPHVRACLLCKAVLDACADSEDEEYMEAALKLIIGHMKARENTFKSVPCNYSGCVHHEEIGRGMALAMIRLGDGDRPWADVRGVKVSTIPLAISPKDTIKGLEAGDIQTGYFRNLKRSAGCVYLRLGPKRTEAHVWIQPAYATRHEAVDDPPTLENLREVFEKVVPAQRVWCVEKFGALKEFTEMSEQFGDRDDGDQT